MNEQEIRYPNLISVSCITPNFGRTALENAMMMPAPPLVQLIAKALRSHARLALLAVAIPISGVHGAEHLIDMKGGNFDAFQEALGRARAYRAAHPEATIVVQLPPKIVLDRTMTFDRRDSGTANGATIVRGAVSGTTISGGAELESADLNMKVVARVPMAQSRVRAYALGKTAAVVFPAFASHSSFSPAQPGRLFVFEGDRRMRPARWPTTGYQQKSKIPPPGADAMVSIALANAPAHLDEEPDAWVAGYWGWNWWYEFFPVRSLDSAHFTFAKPAAPIRPSARFALVNIAAGLDAPGKFYVDKDDARIYLVASPDAANGTPSIPVVDTLVRIVKAENITFEKIAFEKSITSTVVAEGSSHLTFRECYIGHSGTIGLVIDGGIDNRVERCVIDDTGYSGISISGGDPNTLTASGHVVENCRISNFGAVLPSYQPGIRMAGVGISVRGNEILHAPHAGIILFGNDHQIVGNVLHDVLLDSEDSGAIYGGRSWTSRGNVVASNYLYNIRNRLGSSMVRGVYLDDQLSGTTVANNVFINVDEGILLGGGRDNLIQGNLGLRGRGSLIRVDARGLSWQASMVAPGGLLWKSLQVDPQRAELLAKRYAGISTVLTDRPGAPVGNRLIGNIADKTPVVRYDDAAAQYTVESGSTITHIDANAFPTAPATGISTQAIEETRKTITATLSNVASLRFRTRANQ